MSAYGRRFRRMLSREPTSDDLRATFEAALTDSIAGAGVPEGIGLDPETTEALLRVDQSAPTPPTELVQSARDEFEQLLADVLSVEQREGNTVPLSQLINDIGDGPAS